MLKFPATISLLATLLLCSPESNSAQLDQTMHEMGGVMLRLVPWAYSYEAIVPDQVVKDIDRLSALFASSSAHFRNQAISARLNHDLLLQQLVFLTKGARKFRGNSLRMMLTESFALCMSCHSQDPSQRDFLPEESINTLAPGFVKAEFLFMVRSYNQAQAEYLDFLRTTSMIHTDPNRITALERLLVLATRPGITSDNAMGVLSRASSYAADAYETRLLDNWRSALTDISEGAMEPIDPLHPRIEDFASFINHAMPVIRTTNGWQKQQVYWITLRNCLYSFISQHKQSIEMPKLLYWLALADRSLQYRFYDAISRLYLLECITNYSDHPYARQCFDEYELVMIVSFSGSAGLTIPVEIQEQLDKLRVLVY